MSDKKPKKRTRQTAAVTAAGEKPEKIAQDHGGSLYVGGVVGNKGGHGATRSKVRDASLLAFEERIYVLEEIADDPRSKDTDRIRAVDSLGKHGGVSAQDVVPRELVRLLALDVQAVVRSGDFDIEFTGEHTSEEADSDDEDVFLSRFYNRWAMTLGAFRAGDI